MILKIITELTVKSIENLHRLRLLIFGNKEQSILQPDRTTMIGYQEQQLLMQKLSMMKFQQS